MTHFKPHNMIELPKTIFFDLKKIYGVYWKVQWKKRLPMKWVKVRNNCYFVGATQVGSPCHS